MQEKKNLDIAILSAFYPFRGGIAQFSGNIYRELEKLNCKTHAYTFTTQYPNFLFPGETQFVKDDDNADKIDSLRILHSANPLNWPGTARKIKQCNHDILLLNFWMPYFGPSMGFVARKNMQKSKVISILHNVIPHEKKIIDKPFMKYFLKQNHGFIVLSDKVKNDLLHYQPDAKHILLPHPLYDHFGEITPKQIALSKLGLSSDKKTLLFFGFIRDYKGLDLLIDAFGKLDKSYQLVIAGEVYGSFDKYDAQINANPNKENIHKHIKYISDNEVSLYFSAADVCILPYKGATQSGITGISYHFELPMIASNVGGLAEIIHHEKTGLIVSIPEVELFVDSIKQYFEKCDTEIFVQNIIKLKQELSWRVFAEKLLEFAKGI